MEACPRHGCRLQLPCVLLRRGLPWLWEWIPSAKQDWDHYIRKLLGQRQVRNYCDITISGQCFSSSVFIAFRLWHKRWGGRGFICSLNPHGYRQLREGKAARPHSTEWAWWLWKMAAPSGKRETRPIQSFHVGLEMPFRWGHNLLWRGASFYPAAFMAPSSSAVRHNSAGVMTEILLCPLESREHSTELPREAKIVFKGL